MPQREYCVQEPRWVQVAAAIVDGVGITSILVLTGTLVAKAFFPAAYNVAGKFLGW
ncbi:hypothetical protein [Desulfotomaculum copahuensis]|uniref:hypothetical protein n=1 Tax=Desulfotomaculum copahuensis TaxID=1838280 RepID=UPI000B01BCFB|nr:hypothetical protein [Desulfotomaculum copahuensis]